MDMNKYAKDKNLARKFENAIEDIDRGKGWGIFAGLDEGPITITVIHDGGIRFIATPKPKKAQKKPEPVEPTPIPIDMEEEARRLHEGEITEADYKRLKKQVTPKSQPDGTTEDKSE